MTCGCGRKNDPRRRFCGGCGGRLAPACRRCDFQNEVDDRYCGGCGDALGAAPVAPTAAGSLSRAELDELFAPVAAPPAVVELPEGSIGQDDLDRLFGGTS